VHVLVFYPLLNYQQSSLFEVLRLMLLNIQVQGTLEC